jgi:hypothetical protein
VELKRFIFVIGTLYLLEKRRSSQPKDITTLSTNNQEVSKPVVEYVVFIGLKQSPIYIS